MGNFDSSDSSPPFNPYLALIGGVFAVSTGAIFARLADANPLVIAAYRVGIAALVLAPFAWWKARDAYIDRKDVGMGVALGLLILWLGYGVLGTPVLGLRFLTYLFFVVLFSIARESVLGERK